jgi:hypothetical protein
MNTARRATYPCLTSASVALFFRASGDTPEKTGMHGWGTWIRTRINGVRVLYSYQIQLHHAPLRSDSRAAPPADPEPFALRGCDLVTHALALMKVPLPV